MSWIDQMLRSARQTGWTRKNNQELRNMRLPTRVLNVLAFNRFSVLLVLLVKTALILFVFSAAAHAQTSPYANTLVKARYKVFTADINGDGYPDYLLKSTPSVTMVFLDEDEPFPIAYFPGSKTFIISSGTQSSNSVALSPTSDLINSPLWQPANYELIYGDVLGDGLGSMLIRTKTPGGNSFLITLSATDGSPKLHQVFPIRAPANACLTGDTATSAACLAVYLAVNGLPVDLGAGEISITFEQSNNDSRTDMVIRTNGSISHVIVSNESGYFFGGVKDNNQNAEATIVVTWNTLLAHLNAGNVEQAVQYLVPSSRDKYRAVFSSMGEVVKEIPSGLTNFAAVSVSQDIAQFVVDQTMQGQTTMNFVTFVYQGNRWVLWEF